jgi:hypothetical protein
MDNNLLSIIIVTWNTAQVTLKCIKTISKHLKNKINYEIIIVDNASSDNTISEINKLKIVNCKLKIIQNSTNSGFAKGNNIGVKHAKGEYLFFLNSDMEMIDDKLIDMLNFYKNSPIGHIGLIGPKFLNPDLTPQGSVFPPQTALNAFKEFVLNIKNSYSKYTPNSNKPISVWSVSGGAMLIKKDLFLQAGSWNEKYFMYFEDLDLCRSICKLHKEIIYFPQFKVIHAHGQSGKKLASSENQWRRLIPSSIKFHGKINHYFINAIICLGQKLH